MQSLPTIELIIDILLAKELISTFESFAVKKELYKSIYVAETREASAHNTGGAT